MRETKAKGAKAGPVSRFINFIWNFFLLGYLSAVLVASVPTATTHMIGLDGHKGLTHEKGWGTH